MDPYLLKQSIHKDFHYTLSLIIDFLKDNYGEDEMVRIMKEVTKSVYSPLIEELKKEGLTIIEKHMKELMELEKGKYEVEKNIDSIIFKINRCPAIEHMKKNKMQISENFCRISTGLVSTEIAKAAEFKFSVNYDQEKGKCIQKFWKE